MKGTALLVVLMVVNLNSSCVGASLNNKQVKNDEIDSMYLFRIENNTLLLTWNLLNPSGAVQGYRVTWSDGASDKQSHVSGTEATIEYPSSLECYDELTVTVVAMNDDNIPTGNGSLKRFAWQDIVTDVILTPEENRIFASWSIECPSEEVANIVVIWEEVTLSHELSCQFPGTARNTAAPTSCSGGEQILKSCRSYHVFIEPLDSSSNYIGIAERLISYTLEEEYGSKMVETMNLDETKSRSVTLQWRGPNPECPGTTYNITYSETRLGDGQTRKGHAKVVKGAKWSNQDADKSITVNLHPSDNGMVMGHVDNLQPFSDYEFCVAAGNTVANLVCMFVQTKEEKPDKPAHLVLTNEQRSSSTIEVMWKEPSNMNGKLVNYIVRWYRNSKHTDSHNTTKPSYAIVDAEPCVNYTITVTAVNGAGEGEAAETWGAIETANCVKSDCTSTSTGSQEMEVDYIKTPKDAKVNEDDNPTSLWSMPLIILNAALVLLLLVCAILVRKIVMNKQKDEAVKDISVHTSRTPVNSGSSLGPGNVPGENEPLSVAQ